MSYVIFYNLQYIKVDEDKYIPIILQGDNNCYNCIGKSRARDWGYASYLTAHKEGETISKEEIKTYLKNWYNSVKKMYIDNPEYCKDNITEDALKNMFGWYDGCALYGHHTSNTTWRMVYNFFLNKIKKAQTIEELSYRHVRVSVVASSYDYREMGIFPPTKVFPQTTAEFINAINESMAFIKKHNVGYLHINILDKI